MFCGRTLLLNCLLQQRSNVPKFGNWEAEENVPYTAYFDKARKTRAPGSKIMNPNDPEYNSDSQSQAPPHPPSSRTKPEQVDTVRRSREHMRSREESELKQFGDAGGSSNEAANKRQGRASQNNSYDNKSPLHKNSYDGTGKSRPKPTNLRADESVRISLLTSKVRISLFVAYVLSSVYI